MARKPRVYFPGAVYHVMLRGNRGMQIFFHEKDRNYFYFLLEEGIKRYEYEIHSFCLMSNHVHLLLRIGNVCLSKVIQNISFRYTRWINKRKGRMGHLFQGRYKAILVDEENYLLELVRYIHLNPVRANLVGKIEDYRWSSHRVYVDLDKLPWVSTDWVLSRFSEERISAILHYQQFMIENVSKLKSVDFQKGNQRGFDILAEDNFMKRTEMTVRVKKESHIDLEHLIKLICGYYKIGISELKSPSRIRSNAKIRAFIAIISQEFNQCTLTALASYFERDVSGMIKTVRHIRKDIAASDELCKLKNYIEKSTNQA